MNQEKLPNLFRPLAFYHPVSDNSGIATSFSYNSGEDKLYLNILPQTGYDEETFRGFFSGEGKKVVKFSQVEASCIARCIDKGQGFDVVHSFNNIRNEICFAPLESREYELTIQYSEGDQEKIFRTELEIGELNLLRLYIESAIQESFYN